MNRNSIGVLLGVVAILLIAGVFALGSLSAPTQDLTPLPTSVAQGGGGGGVLCSASNQQCVRSLYGRDIAIYSNGGSTLKTALYGNGTILRTGFDVIPPAAAISVTNGITNLTPLGTFQPLTSGGTVTVTSLITSTSVFTTGTIVRLYNTSNTSIVLTNGTYLVLPSATNLTLGQNDAVMIWFDGTKWVAFASVNN